MLREVKTLLPEDLHLEPYPKWKVHQGVGRRKYPDNLSQNKSNFSLCHNPDERCSEGPRGSFSTYQTDFTSAEAINVPNRTRRFPRNHKLRSAEAIVEQAGEQFMWFGQDKSNIPETLEVLGTTNRSAPSKT
ncbi:hypothetical protein GOODEAATRI_020905 [Goodea atripinnis]|uniref:Domain of unknown function with conserved HDNR motif domain-containing protein n=1 Tax=Goodea atripinnis TaxID=208336 RepID=A0ABV0NCQ7_9TELE